MKNQHTSPGMLIVLEGIDGSGKSTLAHALAVELKKTGKEIILTREPGATDLGKQLREIVLKTSICARSEFLLFAADRAQHCAEVIWPALERGAMIISDRMNDSSLIYQGVSHGFEQGELKTINSWAMDGVKANLTFYLKIDPRKALERLIIRGPLTKFESLEQLTQAARGFDELYQHAPNVLTFDAEQPTAILVQMCLEAITKKLNL